MKEYANEGAGALLLTLLVVLLKGESATIFPWAYGAALAALMMAIPSASAFNPVAAVAELLVQERESRSIFWPHRIGAQLSGALLGGLLAAFALNCSGALPKVEQPSDLLCAAFAEGIGACVLAFAFLHASAATQPQQRAFATGLATFAAAAAVQTSAPAVFNPAAYLALAIAGQMDWGSLAVFTLSAILGAAAGASLLTLSRQAPDL